MIFLDRRKQKKLLAELKVRRCAEDDLLSPALRVHFDEIISALENAAGADIAGAVKRAQDSYNALCSGKNKQYGKLPERKFMYSLLDLIFVVGAIAFGLRGLFFQPFRIPTGSMQPTLYGIHHRSSETGSDRIFDKISGTLHHLVYGTADASTVVKSPGGAVDWSSFQEVSGVLFDRTRFRIGNRIYELPGNSRQVADYSGLEKKEFYSGGESIGNGYMTLGDHLFVERFSIYLKEPARGDIIVFNTEGLQVRDSYSDRVVLLEQTGGYYYIKRLAALPGDTVKIVDNQLWVRTAGAEKFVRIQELDGRFDKVYSMRGGYHGHLSNMGEYEFAYGKEYTIPEDCYLMLGDNSKFSMDSRFFGVVPRRNLIGRAWFVFYPFSRRVGLIDRNAPLDKPTGQPGIAAFPVMSEQ